MRNITHINKDYIHKYNILYTFTVCMSGDLGGLGDGPPKI